MGLYKNNSGTLAPLAGTPTSTINTLQDEVSDIVNMYGSKNMLPNEAVTTTISGVTYTVNSDKTITVSGTTTANSYFVFKQYLTEIEIPAGQYIFSCEGITSSSRCSVCLDAADSSGAYVKRIAHLYQSDTVSINIDYDGYVKFYAFVYFANGDNPNGETLKPMLRPASIEDDTYVPYAMNNRELTEKVSVEMSTGTVVTSNQAELVVSNAWLQSMGQLRILTINFYSTNASLVLSDASKLLNYIGPAPKHSYYASARNGGGQTAHLALNGDGGIYTWGEFNSNSTLWSVEFVFFSNE